MTRTPGTPPRPDYPMNRWVFDDTPGKFDIDLSHSYVVGRRLSDLRMPDDLELGYGADRGTEALRQRIAALYHGSPESVLVTHGAQEALSLLYGCLLEPGDQVITFRPGWPQSWTLPALMGCRVDSVPLTEEFGIDVDAVAGVATSRLRLIVVCSPSNPTGRQARPAELHGLLEIVRRHDGYLVLDQDYEPDLTPPLDEGAERTLSVSGLSKVYGFPGLRIGWLYGPAGIVRDCADRKHQTSISNSVLCELLACDVLDRGEQYRGEFYDLVGTGTEILTGWVAERPGMLRLVPPERTPYAWVQLPDGMDSLAFCRRALEHGVLLMPAETLGEVSAFRIGLAMSPAELWDGLKRLSDILDANPVSNGVSRE